MNLHKWSRVGIALLISISLGTATANAQTTTQPPQLSTAAASAKQETGLKNIAFTGAELSAPLTDGVTQYRLTCSVKPADVVLASCNARSNTARISVLRQYDKEERADVFLVTVSQGNDKTDYRFLLPVEQDGAKEDDASLRALQFSQGELSPKFQKDKTTYQLYLPSDVTDLTLAAEPSNGKSTVSAPREIRLNKDQGMKILITVTAPDGVTTYSYTVKIKRIEKTMAQVAELKKDPNFRGLAEQSFTAHPAIYIAIGGTLAALAILLTFLFIRKRRRREAVQDLPKNETTDEER